MRIRITFYPSVHSAHSHHLPPPPSSANRLKWEFQFIRLRLGSDAHVTDFRSTITIKKHIWTHGKAVLDYLTQNSTNCRAPDCVLAAVHIRVRDYATHLVKIGYKPDLMKTYYLSNAFNYTISNYRLMCTGVNREVNFPKREKNL